MILNQENILKGLEEAHLLRNENHYFTSYVTPSVGQVAVLGVFANLLNTFSGYVINVTEDGLGILPINNQTGKFAIEHGVMMPFESVTKVEAKKGFFAYKKINIVFNNNEGISFKVVKRVLPNPNHLENVNYFLNKFNVS